MQATPRTTTAVQLQQQQQQQTEPQHQMRSVISLAPLVQRTRCSNQASLSSSSSRIIRTAGGASVIKVPFLPGSPSTPPTVKQSSPIKKNSNLLTLTSPLKIIDQPIEVKVKKQTNTTNYTQLKQIQQLKPIKVVNTPANTIAYYTIVENSNSNDQEDQPNLNREDLNLIANTQIIYDSEESTNNSNSSNYCNNTKLCAPQQQQQQQQQSLHSSSMQFAQSQSETQTQTSRTLATMAGIQLTGADEHVSPSSMSGATPPATVEEINVPVFITEYLQQPAATITAAATTNTIYSPNSSCSSSSQNCESNSNGIGSNANNNCNNYNDYSNNINGDGFEDFDFDMAMLANSSDVQQQQQQQQKQVFVDNNNTNYNMNINNNCNDFKIGDIIDTVESCGSNKITNNNNNINNLIKSENSEEDLSQQYHILWDNLDEWLTSQDIMNNMEAVPDLPDISENAVNFNNINIKVFDDLLINSQNPMFSCAIGCSSGNGNGGVCGSSNGSANANANGNANLSNLSNSQQFQMELIANSEPFVPKIDQDDIFCDSDSIMVAAIEAREPAPTPSPIAVPSPTPTPMPTPMPIRAATIGGSSSRAVPSAIHTTTTTHNDRTRMQKKRLKLLLPSVPVLAVDSLSTPSVLGGIVDMEDEQMAMDTTTTAKSSFYLCGSPIAHIEESLKEDTTSHFSTYTDEESPATPHSSYSSYTTCTNEYSTIQTAYSPAPSNYSTSTSNQQQTTNSTTTTTTKKRRGRPAKEHSDQPDPAKLMQMPEAERKRLMDRAKNNEASRQSRKKNKEREELEKEIERKLIERNLVLKTRRKDLVKLEKKLKRALMRSTIFSI